MRAHKATTYPRTDSGYLPESMLAEVSTVLDSLVKTDPGLCRLIEQIDRQPALSCLERRQGHGAPRHHPDAGTANLSAMNDKELAVYRLIRAHYLAQFLLHHEFDRTVAQLSCGGQALEASRQADRGGWLRTWLLTPEAG
jgi:DNA topoisomerase-3